LFQWLPYYASNTIPIDTVDAYAIRSGYAPAVVLGYDLRRNDLDTARLRTLTEQWRSIVPLFAGDFYLLTPYSIDENQWYAWQFLATDGKQGCVQIFRRSACDDSARSFKLKALDPAAEYQVRDLDTATPTTLTGKALMDQGIPITLPSKPAAAVFVYLQK
jgi:hypothetical protein